LRAAAISVDEGDIRTLRVELRVVGLAGGPARLGSTRRSHPPTSQITPAKDELLWVHPQLFELAQSLRVNFILKR
jgi:hypothetical protein